MKKRIRMIITLTLVFSMLIGMYASAASSRTYNFNGKTVAASVTLGSNGSYVLSRIDYPSNIYLLAEATGVYVKSNSLKTKNKRISYGSSKYAAIDVFPDSGYPFIAAKSEFHFGANSMYGNYNVWSDLGV